MVASAASLLSPSSSAREPWQDDETGHQGGRLGVLASWAYHSVSRKGISLRLCYALLRVGGCCSDWAERSGGLRAWSWLEPSGHPGFASHAPSAVVCLAGPPRGCTCPVTVTLMRRRSPLATERRAAAETPLLSLCGGGDREGRLCPEPWLTQRKWGPKSTPTDCC